MNQGVFKDYGKIVYELDKCFERVFNKLIDICCGTAMFMYELLKEAS
jgi:hypothetical protein